MSGVMTWRVYRGAAKRGADVAYWRGFCFDG